MPRESWNELFELQVFWCKVAAVQKVVLLFNLFPSLPSKAFSVPYTNSIHDCVPE